jgi:hypothetical protein
MKTEGQRDAIWSPATKVSSSAPCPTMTVITTMKLTSADKLTQEKQQKLANAALKNRPDPRTRAEFKMLTRRRRRLKGDKNGHREEA